MSDDPLLWEPYDRHWIRLRGPWMVTWLAPSGSGSGSGSGDESEPQRVKLPVSWAELFGDRLGTARFERRFQRPTNLDADERVVVTLCEVGCDVVVRINDKSLTPLEEPLGDPASVPCEVALSFDVTKLLQATNRLTLDLTVSGPPLPVQSRGLWRPVLLEVITLD